MTIQKLELDNYQDPLFRDFRERLLDFLTIQLRLDGVLTGAQSVQSLDFNEKACIWKYPTVTISCHLTLNR